MQRWIMTQFSEDELWVQLFQLATQVQERIRKHTVGFYTYQDGIKVAGTGVLFRVAQRHFVLSAAHVLDYTFRHGFLFHSLGPDSKLHPVEFIRRRSSKCPDSGRDDDPLDISVAEFTPETASMLSATHEFIGIEQIETELGPACGVIVLGFPEVYSSVDEKGELNTGYLSFATTPYQGPPEPGDERREILLYYHDDGLDLSAQDPSPLIKMPRPHGISGCGIWRISQPPVLPKDTSLSEYRLVGIQHTWLKNRQCLGGTSGGVSRA